MPHPNLEKRVTTLAPSWTSSSPNSTLFGGDSVSCETQGRYHCRREPAARCRPRRGRPRWPCRLGRVSLLLLAPSWISPRRRMRRNPQVLAARIYRNGSLGYRSTGARSVTLERAHQYWPVLTSFHPTPGSQETDGSLVRLEWIMCGAADLRVG